MNKYDIDNIDYNELTKEQILGKISYYELSLEIENLDKDLKEFREARLPLLKKQLKQMGGGSWIEKID